MEASSGSVDQVYSNHDFQGVRWDHYGVEFLHMNKQIKIL